MNQRSERAVIIGEKRRHLLGLGRFGKGGEAAQVAEQDDNIPAMALENFLAAGRTIISGFVVRESVSNA